MQKNRLKTKRKRAATMPVGLETVLVQPATTAIDTACPAAPQIISLRRPNFSMVKIATIDAKKHSVPFKAARRRDVKGESPRLFSKIVAA